MSVLRILIINPNTSNDVTRRIEESITPYKRSDVKLRVVNPEKGPIAIESYYHKYMASSAVFRLAEEAETDNYDAVVVACFSDPGLEGAKELVSIPIVGIGEASVILAALLGNRFSIIVILQNSISRAERLVKNLGLTSKLASIKSIGLGVVELESNREKGEKLIFEKCKEAIAEDGAESIILGCAGMSGIASKLQQKLAVPLIDPTVAALKMAEMLVDMGLSNTKVMLYGKPKKVG